MKTNNKSFPRVRIAMAVAPIIAMLPGLLWAANASRFLAPEAWQCTFEAEMNQDVEKATGPGGMASDSKRQFFQALESVGTKVESPGGNTDSYHQKIEQTVKGKVRLHSVYDGGSDGIQIAGWQNGGADVHAKTTFAGTEQNRTVIRDKTATFDGFTKLEGDEYEPSFQIWIYPEDNTYAVDYSLSAVPAQQVEHCRMAEEMEPGRQKMESATDADMPLGGMMSALTKFTCATEKSAVVDLDGGALRAAVENVPLPRSGLVLEGQGDSLFIDTPGVSVRWSCRPE